MLAASPPALAAPLDYNRDIRPILSENCFSCHGFDEKARKAHLRLDVAESAYSTREGVTRIKPGDAVASEVWQRIISPHDDEVMPPPESHLKLTAAQKQKLKAWIEQGAVYAPHWSLVAPVKSAPPPITFAAEGGTERTRDGEIKNSPPLSVSSSLPLASNPIDAFVRAQLAAEKLTPAPEADRPTLIRRLALDLTGLPPSAAEVAAFVADRAPEAYGRLVDRLLASPHFGERLALDWLDAARYADTNGFSIDGGRHLWLWRDWVIQAYNDNKPYDTFLVEQLAGDLLPEATEAQRIATGFQRNNMVTHEGGTIPEENLLNYNADRVKTLGEAVLGLTFACAQCHDHKFDPITQRDYYSLFAFFNTLGDRGLDGNAGVNPGPSIKARTVLQTDEVPALQQAIVALEQKLARPDAAILAAWEKREQARLAARGRDLRVIPLRAVKVSTPNRGAGFEVTADGRVRLRNPGDLAAFDILAELPRDAGAITGLRFVLHPQEDLPLGGWGNGPTRPADPAAKKKKGASMPEQKGTFKLTAVALSADSVPGDQVNLHKLEPIARVTASSWEPQNPAAGVLDPRNDSGWSPELATEGPVHLTATLARPLDPAEAPHLTVQLNFGAGRGMIPGLIEVCAITGTDDGTDLPAEIVAALGTPAAQRTTDARAALWRHGAAHGEELARDRIALANLRDRLAALTEPFTTMVMEIAAKPRDTFILNRGDYAQPTVQVSAATPAALPPLPAGAPANRLGLAHWIVARENPLTARVAVNRFWKLFFGTGLVATPADFGAQGEWPSHPELLDWLAVDFMEHGWDVKRLVRLIVTSAAYRQSSAATPAQLERDPHNRLLARGPRFRLPAEFVRDQALAVSGLLVPRLGGPSVNPYTPGDLWREVSHYGSSPATAQTFVQDHGEKLYRRSLYTYWKRTAPPPSMMAFDAPNREVCTVARGNTTTPLQALVTLNDPQFVEAARAFAERIIARPGQDAARLGWAFAECLSRPPRSKELGVLAVALERERARYAQDEAAARAYLAVGESPRNESIPPAEHAAWAQVATTLLNLSETITRN
ncbi:MAG: PSD1 and planctomycete cytochrome C domain-containing protein [Opitutaceae bacterium]|nr:PSD1 and planctomycete cytochrome C domain-containing protein [Opitutaceae bacterium]